jgi:N6-L-threonylcarbamoyladenine synthase
MRMTTTMLTAVLLCLLKQPRSFAMLPSVIRSSKKGIVSHNKCCCCIHRQNRSSCRQQTARRHEEEDTTAHSTTIQGVNNNNNNGALLSPAEKRHRAREARKKSVVGLAKAVDRGQFSVTYQPGGSDGQSFRAWSGLPDRTRPFTVLGIESSCDDTGAAVIRSDGVILGEALASQREIHEQWGGVVPGLARDAHVATIDGVVQQALANAGMRTAAEVDAIGVTVGPGLAICLRVGSDKARKLALEYGKPFVGVNHLEAHVLMARLSRGSGDDNFIEIPATSETHASFRAMDFPFLALLVSGGHCQLMKCSGIGNYTILGGTLDDSLGEAFDKTARLLGLPVGGGGGPAVEELALLGDPSIIAYSVPLQARKDCDFSFSGLKSNVRRSSEELVEERGVQSVTELPKQDKANIAASFQNVAIKHIEQRLQRAMNVMEAEGIRTLALVGGVAANQALRSRLETLCIERDSPWKMVVPPPWLCTDQGSMSAWAAVERLMVGSSDDPSTQEVYARFPFATTTTTATQS